MESNAHTTSSTALRASADPDGPVIPKIPGPRQPSGIGPRPAPPARPLTATMPAPLRSIDWNGHIPTAPKPATLTRAQLDREIQAARLHEPYLIGHGGTQAHAAFGGAA